MRLLVFTFLCLAELHLASGIADAAEWPYSVPVESSQTRRAYLWIAPDCRQVRGLLVGLQNMLERPMFEDAEIRKVCADSGLDIRPARCSGNFSSNCDTNWQLRVRQAAD